ncbi:MAG: tetraacyldisaccharide 4'-kinase [Planctomycetaceae bacterium]
MSHSGEHPISDVRDQPVTVMTAIGNPEAFVTTCRELGANVVTSMFFPDHHHYTESDLEHVRQHAQNSAALRILTTQKDFVKIPHSNEDILAVRITTQFESASGAQKVRDELAALTKIPPSLDC